MTKEHKPKNSSIKFPHSFLHSQQETSAFIMTGVTGSVLSYNFL